MAMTVPRQNIALLSVLVNQSQAARLNGAQDVSRNWCVSLFIA